VRGNLLFLGDDRDLVDPLFEFEQRSSLHQQDQHAGNGESESRKARSPLCGARLRV
jgi:hypothetical protein